MLRDVLDEELTIHPSSAGNWLDQPNFLFIFLWNPSNLVETSVLSMIKTISTNSPVRLDERSLSNYLVSSYY